jgi:hypothetical protein
MTTRVCKIRLAATRKRPRLRLSLLSRSTSVASFSRFQWMCSPGTTWRSFPILFIPYSARLIIYGRELVICCAPIAKENSRRRRRRRRRRRKERERERERDVVCAGQAAVRLSIAQDYMACDVDGLGYY